jgi:hypothetical protein
MARLGAPISNDLFKILADWNDVLKGTSLNQNEQPVPRKRVGRRS